MKIAFDSFDMPKSDVVVVLVAEEALSSPTVEFYNQLTAGAVVQAIADQLFKGKSGQALQLVRPQGGLQSLLLVGIGKASEWNALKAMQTGGDLLAKVAEGAAKVSLLVDDIPGAMISAAEAAGELAYGALLRSYKFEKYFTKKKKTADGAPVEEPIKIDTLNILVRDVASASQIFADCEPVAKGVFFARDLVSEPANVLYPESYAERLKPLKDLGLEIEILTEKQLEAMGFHLMLSVGQGSARDSQLGIMIWRGLGDDTPPLALVGKGITFDTGGISIKPSAGMGEMKWDMAGSAAVVGTMIALASRKARVNAVGVIALAENMPSGTATRPGDVVVSLSGQTVENLNTDAEGRLVLADAVWYTEERFKPAAIIDLATLTGAILVALGDQYAGLFASDDQLAAQLTVAAAATGEKIWRMPLDYAYNKELDSDIADMKNIGAGRNAGAALGAHFIKRFIRTTPWAHLDIAGMAWAAKANDVTPKGATAWGVRLLDQLVRDNFERRDA
jgi:leucyl aminopeptidase